MPAAGEVPNGPSARSISDLQTDIQEELRTGEFTVPLSGISDGAWKYFLEKVSEFADGLAKETSRLEEAHRERDLPTPEITSSMIQRAFKKQLYLELPEPAPSKRVPWWFTVMQVVTAILGITTGVVGSYLNSTEAWVVFTVLLMLTIGSTAFVAIWSRHDS
jgi:hypothetical protein